MTQMLKNQEVVTTYVLKDGGSRKLPFDEKRLRGFIEEQAVDYPQLNIQPFVDKIVRMVTQKESIDAKQITNLIILEGLSNIAMDEPDWTYFCARVKLQSIYHEAAKNRAYDPSLKYGSFYGLLKTLGSKGIYSSLILKEYSKAEIDEAQKFIDPSKDHLFNYIGLKTLADRYIATDHDRNVYELPQERFLVIAMVLMSKENKKMRLKYVKQAYWALSNLYMTVATPTLANAGKTHGQLSSCFIDTVDDNLQSIYDNNTDVANLSKNGGGINSQCLLVVTLVE